MNKLTGLLGGRGIFASEINERIKLAYGAVDIDFFADDHSINQKICEYNGVKYVTDYNDRSLKVLGVFNPAKPPEAGNKYGFNAINNPEVIRYKIELELVNTTARLGSADVSLGLFVKGLYDIIKDSPREPDKKLISDSNKESM